MIYKVSTTGVQSSVVLYDMAERTLVHPEVELDLGLEYTDDELTDSVDLQSAIDNNWLTVVEKSGGVATEEYVDDTVSTVSGILQDHMDEAGILPAQAGHAGELLGTDGTNSSWMDVTEAVKAMMVYNSVVQTNVDTAESLRLEGTTRLDSGFSMGGTNSTEITVSSAGWYEFQYSVAWDSDYGNRVTMRVYVERDGSGSWVDIDQSYSYEYLRYNTYGRMSNNTASFFMQASASEKFRVRMDGATTGGFPSTSVDSDTILNQCWVTVKSIDFDGIRGSDGIDGSDGSPGPAGSGSTINVYNDGSVVSGGPFQVLNFKNFGDVSSVVSGTVDVTAPVFGLNYDYTFNDSTTNTNSTTPLNKLTLTTSSLPAGNYRVGWYYEWRRNTASNDFRARVQIDNTTTVTEHSEESKDVNSWHIESGFVQHTFTAGSHTVDVDYWGESSGSTSYIRRVRIELWRVS